ncbi:hypothetical protein Agub_g8317, partial [Astrephomene gubernaculifera]
LPPPPPPPSPPPPPQGQQQQQQQQQQGLQQQWQQLGSTAPVNHTTPRTAAAAAAADPAAAAASTAAAPTTAPSPPPATTTTTTAATAAPSSSSSCAAPAAAPAAASPPRIFVSLAAYRDPECQWTLHSIFANAERPERVRVGVVWQVDPVADQQLVRVAGERSHPEWLDRVRHIVLPHTEAEGPCRARWLAGCLWGGEQFVLQLDSHMRLVPGWDELCIQQLAAAEELSDTGKALLSTYPL